MHRERVRYDIQILQGLHAVLQEFMLISYGSEFMPAWILQGLIIFFHYLCSHPKVITSYFSPISTQTSPYIGLEGELRLLSADFYVEQSLRAHCQPTNFRYIYLLRFSYQSTHIYTFTGNLSFGACFFRRSWKKALLFFSYTLSSERYSFNNLEITLRSTDRYELTSSTTWSTIELEMKFYRFTTSAALLIADIYRTKCGFCVLLL